MDLASEENWPRRQLLITHRLRQRRAELRLTQEQVVTRLWRAGLRTTNRAVSSLEHGAGIDVAKLPELAAALDCTVTYLVGLTEDPHRWEPDDPRGAQPQLVSGGPATLAAQPSTSARSLILGVDIPDRVSPLGTSEIRPGR
jgi:hypothetical protein